MYLRFLQLYMIIVKIFLNWISILVLKPLLSNNINLESLNLGNLNNTISLDALRPLINCKNLKYISLKMHEDDRDDDFDQFIELLKKNNKNLETDFTFYDNDYYGDDYCVDDYDNLTSDDDFNEDFIRDYYSL